MSVEGFDLLGDGEVVVWGGGLGGDAGMDHGCREGLVADLGGDGVEAHAPVDGLGGEGVAEMVGGDVVDAGVDGLGVEDLVDPVDGEGRGRWRSMRRRSERTLRACAW